MALKMKQKECERKLEEADKALERAIECIEGFGEVGKKRITLLIQRAGEDGKGNPRGL